MIAGPLGGDEEDRRLVDEAFQEALLLTMADTLSGGPYRPLPEYLERFLSQVLHYEDAEIARTSREEAQALLNAHFVRELREP